MIAPATPPLPDQLWHTSERHLDIGAEIEPGRWGQWVRFHGPSHPSWAREVLLEEVRAARWPAIEVSRWSCCYAYEDMPTVNLLRWDHHVVYRVRPAIAGPSVHRGDMLWTSWLSEPGRSDEAREGWADAYWSGEPTTTRMPAATVSWEWLIDSPLVVLGRQ